MAAQPAIRNTDQHVCPKHGPDRIGAVAELDVTVNNEAALHVGHCFTCAGNLTHIATGSTTVRVHGEFAARAFDDSSHKGKLLIGSRNVVIGGPKGMGCVGAGKKECEKLCAGRASGRNSQSYGNCMVESLRQIVQHVSGQEVKEEDMLNQARDKMPVGLNTFDESPRYKGATSPEAGAAVLNSLGIEAENIPEGGSATLGDIRRAIADRRGVVVCFDAGPVWPTSPESYHATLVTGVELDDRGEVVAVFMNDTGLGACGRRVPADTLQAGMKAYPRPLVVTKRPIW